MRNVVEALVEVFMTYHLIIDTIHHLDLLETFCVPSFSSNLVSLSKLDFTGYFFNLDGLYVEIILTLCHNVGTKRSLVKERSTFL